MVARNVAEIVADHVRLRVEAIDRMYLNIYVPRLQCAYVRGDNQDERRATIRMRTGRSV